MKTDDESVREHVLYLLTGRGAHSTFEEVLAGLPADLRGRKPPGIPHTPWRLLEHMRIAQWDILEFSRNPAHVSPDWPDGYWPAGDEPSRASDWERSVEQFRADRDAMMGLVKDPRWRLYEPFAHGDGQTLLREALLTADHNAYHLGQLMTVRRLLEAR